MRRGMWGDASIVSFAFSVAVSLALALVGASAVDMPSARAATYYAAPDGSEAGDGSQANPWPLSYGVAQLQGGDTLLAMDGTYEGVINTSRSFDDWVTIRAEHPYRAKLTNVANAGPVLFIYTKGSAKIIIEGFVLSNFDPSYTCTTREGEDLVHFQDAQDIVFRDNILFGNNAPGTCNELLKINRGGDPYYPRNILVVGNVFYDRANAPGADLIDSVRPGELDIAENIFFSRSSDNAQSFITIKRQVDAASLGITPRSPRYNISRNVFLSWHGPSDQAFIQLGEDANAEVMISDALIENNLIIGNSPTPMGAPFQFKGARHITVRGNTVVGDLPARGYGFRIGTEGDNLQVRDMFIYNNIFSDPTGTMGDRFITEYGDVDVSTFVLDNNLYYNAGAALPTAETPAPGDDQHGIVADPLLNDDQSDVILPVWDETTHQFASGSTTIRQEFERLVATYGVPGQGSPVVDAADPSHMPSVDILGRPRDGQPDIGAVELGAESPDGGHDGGIFFDSGLPGADAGPAGTDASQASPDAQSSGPEEATQGCGCSSTRQGDEPGLLLCLLMLTLFLSLTWWRKLIGRRCRAQ